MPPLRVTEQCRRLLFTADGAVIYCLRLNVSSETVDASHQALLQ